MAPKCGVDHPAPQSRFPPIVSRQQRCEVHGSGNRRQQTYVRSPKGPAKASTTNEGPAKAFNYEQYRESLYQEHMQSLRTGGYGIEREEFAGARQQPIHSERLLHEVIGARGTQVGDFIFLDHA